MVYFIFYCMSLHVCLGDFFYFGQPFDHFLERNCPFGFLLVML